MGLQIRRQYSIHNSSYIVVDVHGYLLIGGLTECDLSVDIKIPGWNIDINESNEPGAAKIHWNFEEAFKYLSHLYQFLTAIRLMEKCIGSKKEYTFRHQKG